jgi:hypothetical protein
MATYPYPLCCTPVPNSAYYKLVEKYVVNLPSGNLLHIPKDFMWDGASIPRVFWKLLDMTPYDPRVLRASCVHDYLYNHTSNMPRDEADMYFKILCIEDGVPAKTANIMFDAVSTFGSFFYWNNKDAPASLSTSTLDHLVPNKEVEDGV